MIKTYTIECGFGHGEYTSEFCDGECPACGDDEAPVWEGIPNMEYKMSDDDKKFIAKLTDGHLGDESDDLDQLFVEEIIRETLWYFRPDLFSLTAPSV